MQEPQGHIEPAESGAASRVSRILKQHNTWSTTVKADPHKHSEFESVLLAIAGHDLRQPLQVIRNAHELLGRGDRTKSELRQLWYVQSAIDRLRDQLDELVAALHLREHAKGVKLTPVRVGDLLECTAHENEVVAQTKGIIIRTVPTSATIESDALLLGAVLRNLVSNAVKYTKPGGSVLLGCRQTGQSARIDVYDTGIGITEDQMARIFEAFTRLDPTCDDGLGIGLFIVRQAIGILGHRIDVASTPHRGSRFSIFASGAGDTGSDHQLAKRTRPSPATSVSGRLNQVIDSVNHSGSQAQPGNNGAANERRSK
jgi:two-component system, OmpR family, phosphate regulon sensor histidine kinase PhoR